MSGWLKILACAFITVFLGVVLKELGFKGVKLISLLTTVSLIGASVIYLGELISVLPGLSGSSKEYAKAILKIVGVGYAFGICSDVCRELGETSLANAVILFGRIEIIMISLPFVKMILEKGVELI